MSVKQRVFESLDRPWTRWALPPVGSVFVTARRRTPCFVTRSGNTWVHRYPDGVVVQRVLGGDTVRELDRITRDEFFYKYTVKDGDTVVDVGAGTGGELLTFSRLAGDAGRVVSIEAHPETARCLEMAAELNQLTNVTVVSSAVSDHSGTIVISDDVAHIGNSTNVMTGQEVPAVRLDDLLEQLGIESIDFLKMNVEGAERPALDGMTSSLSRVRNLSISCHDFKADRTGDDWFRTKKDVKAQLTASGFTVCERIDQRPWIADTLYGVRP